MKRLWLCSIALAIAFGVTGFQSSAQVPSWAKTYDGGGGGGAADVRQTADGGFLAAGWTKSSVDAFTDMWLVRLDTTGIVVWQRSYGGAGREEIETLHPTPDGGYIGIGLSSSFGASNHAPLVLKFDANGNVQWQKTYLSSGRDWGFDIVQTSDGGYVIPGMTDPCACGGTTQGTIIKIDASGNILWQKIYTGQSTFSSIRQTSDGGYIMGGAAASFGDGGGDALVLKLDATGNIQWQNTYGGSAYDGLVVIQLTTDGGYILGGSTQSFGSGGTDAWLLKLNSDGSVAWQKAYGGSGDETASYVEQTADGGYIVSGYTTTGAITGTDLWVFKTDSSGNFIWQRSYDSGSPSDNAYAIHPTSDGGYVVAGNSDPGCPSGCVPPATPQKFTILKLKSDGSIDPSCATGVGAITTAATANTSAVIFAAPLVASSFGANTIDTNVTVTNTAGQATSLCVSGLQPSITSIFPKSGTQGQTISNFTVNGNNFDGTSILSFSGTGITASTMSPSTPSQLVATVIVAPNTAPGLVDVILTNPDGNKGILKGGFTVVPAPSPSITSISPNFGNQGQTIANFVVNGSNFESSSTVSFSGKTGDFAINYLSRTPTQIVASVSISTIAQIGRRDLVVTDPNFQSTAVLAAGFNILPACQVSGITIDKKNSNKVVDVSSTGSGCDYTLMITNLKSYWTNFEFTTIGAVTAQPVGSFEPYQQFRLLAPGKPTKVLVHFSGRGQGVSIFVDPSKQSGVNASFANLFQGGLDFLSIFYPTIGNTQLVIEDFPQVLQAFAQMPHFTKAATDLFGGNPNILDFLKQVRAFTQSNEPPILAGLLLQLGIDIGENALVAVLKTPGAVASFLQTLIQNFRAAIFEPTAGSIAIQSK